MAGSYQEALVEQANDRERAAAGPDLRPSGYPNAARPDQASGRNLHVSPGDSEEVFRPMPTRGTRKAGRGTCHSH